MNILHNTRAPDTVTGNVKSSWYQLEISEDDRIEFYEFEKFNQQFPQLFRPAFELQIKMINAFMGEDWWRSKKRRLQNIKDAKKAKADRKKAKLQNRKERVRANKIRKKMGILRYYLMPCFRSYYAPPIKPEAEIDEEKRLEEERKKKREEEIAQARKQDDLAVKNQETAEWQKYEKKINPEKGGKEEYIQEKIVKIKKARTQRVEQRKDRKQRRQQEVNDGFDLRPKLNDLPEI